MSDRRRIAILIDVSIIRYLKCTIYFFEQEIGPRLIFIDNAFLKSVSFNNICPHKFINCVASAFDTKDQKLSDVIVVIQDFFICFTDESFRSSAVMIPEDCIQVWIPLQSADELRQGASGQPVVRVNKQDIIASSHVHARVTSGRKASVTVVFQEHETNRAFILIYHGMYNGHATIWGTVINKDTLNSSATILLINNRLYALPDIEFDLIYWNNYSDIHINIMPNWSSTLVIYANVIKNIIVWYIVHKTLTIINEEYSFAVKNICKFTNCKYNNKLKNMNRSPKVSVIVPNYNHSAFLKERIDTILQQTYQDFELIILDDCSTDNSVSIIESYRNNEHVTHIVLNEQNSGSTFLQWDKGVSLAQGEYIWIAESDDAAHPQFLSTLVEQLERHPEAVIAYAHSLWVNEKGETTNDKRHHLNDGSVFMYDGQKFAHRAMLPNNCIYNASMAIFRHDVYEKVDKSFQQYRMVGDWKFWMGVCLQGSVIEVCQMLNYFRRHSNKVTFKFAASGKDWPEILSLLHSFIPQLNLKGKELRTFRGRWTRNFKKSHYHNKKELTRQYPDILQASMYDKAQSIMMQRLFKVYRYY